MSDSDESDYDFSMSEETSPQRMQKSSRFQMMITRSKRRSQTRRMRHSYPFGDDVADFEIKKMETRSTKKRRMF